MMTKYVDTYLKRPTPPPLQRGDPIKKKNKRNGLKNEQIYGHGSPRGPILQVTVPAGCQQQVYSAGSAVTKTHRTHTDLDAVTGRIYSC
jgi:hypothetical protein